MRSLNILVLTVIARTVVAQTVPWAARDLRIVDSMRVDPRKDEVLGLPMMALRGDGTIAVASNGDILIYFDSLGHRRWARDLDRDIRMLGGIGWKGDSIFVVDNF